jgi:hypothetical protein
MSVLLILHWPGRQNAPSGRRVTGRRMRISTATACPSGGGRTFLAALRAPTCAPAGTRSARARRRSVRMVPPSLPGGRPVSGSSTGHGCRCQGVEWRGLRDYQHHPAVDEVSGSGGVSRGSLSGRAVG